MICLGFTPEQKKELITDYYRQQGLSRCFVLSPSKFFFDHGADVTGAETVEWDDLIQYRYFYRLLQEIDSRTLVVVNECLRLQNRNDLTYNCMRHFLNQAHHQLIFQWFPQIDTEEDFMILFDFDTRSRWKGERFDVDLLSESEIRVHPRQPKVTPIPVPTDDKLVVSYEKQKAKLFDNLGARDPHTLPRNLHLIPGKAKKDLVEPGRWYVGRNQRFKLPQFQTFREESYPNAPYTVFEFTHMFRRFSDFLCLSGQLEVEALVSDLKVDQWYLERYQAWTNRIATTLQRVSPTTETSSSLS